MTHPAPGDPHSQQLGKCREGRMCIPPDKEKPNKVRSNCRKRLCGRFGQLSPLEAACFHFKTAVVSGHQTVCSSSRGWVASRGVTRACKSLLPEFSRTGLLAQLLTGALPARLAKSVWRCLSVNQDLRLQSVGFGISVSSEHGCPRAWPSSMEAIRPSQ